MLRRPRSGRLEASAADEVRVAEWYGTRGKLRRRRDTGDSHDRSHFCLPSATSSMKEPLRSEFVDLVMADTGGLCQKAVHVLRAQLEGRRPDCSAAIQ